jgi:hypothetical protein
LSKLTDKNVLPIAVLIEFDCYTGSYLFFIKKNIYVKKTLCEGSRLFERNDFRFNWIPINPWHAYSPKYNVTRDQIPCRLSYACTIHKSQGQTLTRCIIDLGNFIQIIQ